MKFDINLEHYPKLKNNNDIERTINYLLLIGYNHVYINEQTNLVEQISNRIKNDINCNEKFTEIDEHINKLFGLSSSSNKKGEVSENIIYELINNNYKDYCYDKKRTIAHNADGELNSPSGLKSLVEIKNYEVNVNKDEVKKFKNDLINTNINFGLFISIKSNIIGYKYFDYETFIHNQKEYHIIYISKIYENDNLLNCAIMLLEKIYSLKSNTNIKSYQFSNIKEHLKELNNIFDKTKDLHDKLLNLENVIKSSFNDFYQNFRKYEIDLNNQFNIIWTNIEEDIETVYFNNSDNKESILSKFSEDKCLIIMSRLFELLNDYDIIIEDNIWNVIKNTKHIATIKKFKDKLNIDFNNSIKISLDKKNLDTNLIIISNILNSI